MSRCISYHGEYSDHVLDGEGFYCTRCGDLDDVTLTERLRTAEAQRAEALTWLRRAAPATRPNTWLQDEVRRELAAFLATTEEPTRG